MKEEEESNDVYEFKRGSKCDGIKRNSLFHSLIMCSTINESHCLKFLTIQLHTIMCIIK